MPEKLKWEFGNVNTPITMDLNDLLAGKRIEYLTDKGWEEVTLVGFKTHTLSSTGFTIKGVYVEVLPLAGTEPIKVFHSERLRAKDVDVEPGTKEIEEI